MFSARSLPLVFTLAMFAPSCGSNADDPDKAAAGSGGSGGAGASGAQGGKGGAMGKGGSSSAGKGGTNGEAGGGSGAVGGSTGDGGSSAAGTAGQANAGGAADGGSGTGVGSGGSGSSDDPCFIPEVVHSCSMLDSHTCTEYFEDYPLEDGCTQSGGAWSDEPCPRDGLVAYCLNQFPEDDHRTIGAFYYAENPVYQIQCGSGSWCVVDE